MEGGLVFDRFVMVERMGCFQEIETWPNLSMAKRGNVIFELWLEVPINFYIQGKQFNDFPDIKSTPRDHFNKNFLGENGCSC